MLLIKFLPFILYHPSQQSLYFIRLFKDRASQDDQCTPGVWQGLGCHLWNGLSSPRNVFGIYRARVRECDDNSPAPSPLGVWHSPVLYSWPFRLECNELYLTHLPSISLGKKYPRGILHSFIWPQPSRCLWDFISSLITATNWCPSLKCPSCEARHSWSSSDFYPSLRKGQELHSEEEVPTAASLHKFWLGAFITNITFPPLKMQDLCKSSISLLKAQLVSWKLWRQVDLMINTSTGIYLWHKSRCYSD